MSKASINLPDGTSVVIEGSPEEVAKVLALYGGKTSTSGVGAPSRKNKKPAKKKVGKKSKQGKKGGITVPKISKDLDLSGGKKGEGLRDFFSKYKPSSNLERNLVFVYYLKQVIDSELVSINHIFTCYRYIKGLKLPGHLNQSLFDTCSLKGWIDTASLNDIKLTVPGINYIEYDMKKAEEKDA